MLHRVLKMNDPNAEGAVYDLWMAVKATGITNPIGELHFLVVDADLPPPANYDDPFPQTYIDEFQRLARSLYA